MLRVRVMDSQGGERERNGLRICERERKERGREQLRNNNSGDYSQTPF